MKYFIYIMLICSSLVCYARVSSTMSMKGGVVTQPDGKKFKVDGIFSGGEPVGVVYLVNSKIAVTKAKDGYYYLAIIDPNPKYTEYRVLYYTVHPSDIRADSPTAYKIRIKGKWHFFIRGTNEEVSFRTKKAILPDWPLLDLPPAGTRLKAYFTGKFNPDGSPIFQSVKNKKNPTYRTPFAGSIDGWFIAIAFFWLWKRRCR